MAGIDRLVANEFAKAIKNNLEQDDLKKVERTLFMEHGMSIKLAIEHFEKLEKILKKNNIEREFEKKCLDEICKINKSKNHYSIEILNQELQNIILESCGENENRRLLKDALKSDFTIPEILKKSSVPKTSGYRKIENLIINGILIETRKVLSASKKISKYKCVFDESKIHISNEKTKLTILVDQKLFEKSSIVKILEKN